MLSRYRLMHVDTLDLYDARRRITFCRQAAAEVFTAHKGDRTKGTAQRKQAYTCGGGDSLSFAQVLLIRNRGERCWPAWPAKG